MDSILKVINLRKEYEGVVALDDVSLEITRGSIFGLLGPNGAGKTSLIRILTGISYPDGGSFVLDKTQGNDFDTLSKMIGYLPEERGLYQDIKISEQLEFLGRIKGFSLSEVREKIAEYSKKMGIDGWLDKKAQELSKGMQQMVQFTATIFFEPSLIILDEPFTGLDPINSNKMKQALVDLQKQGKTIIFSTHRMEQVEEICEKIALINKGNIILEGSIADVKSSFKKNIYKVEYHGQIDKSQLPSDCEIIDESSVEVEGAETETYSTVAQEMRRSGKNSIFIKDNNASSHPSTILKKLIPHIEISSFMEILPSLNEIFIEAVKSIDTRKDV
jgi:ABC-2 type transport system ATP-binding protein